MARECAGNMEADSAIQSQANSGLSPKSAGDNKSDNGDGEVQHDVHLDLAHQET